MKMKIMKNEYPKPWANLSEDAEAIYYRLWDYISPHLGLEDVDAFVICSAAQAFALAKRAYDSIEADENGIPIKTYSNNTQQVSPLYTLWKNSLAEGNKFLKEAGMTPKGRMDLGLFEEKEDEVDPVKEAMMKIAEKASRNERGVKN